MYKITRSNIFVPNLTLGLPGDWTTFSFIFCTNEASLSIEFLLTLDSDLKKPFVCTFFLVCLFILYILRHVVTFLTFLHHVKQETTKYQFWGFQWTLCFDLWSHQSRRHNFYSQANTQNFGLDRTLISGVTTHFWSKQTCTHTHPQIGIHTYTHTNIHNMMTTWVPLSWKQDCGSLHHLSQITNEL